MRQDLRNSSGKLIGYTQSSGSVTEMRSAAGHLLGRYDSRQNETRSSSGSLIGRGDFLSSLL